MAIYKEDIVSIELENGVIHRSFLNHSIGSGDAAANRFGIRVFRNGSEVDLSGVSCQAYFQNAEGTNIALTSYGTVSGNVAYVTLPQACYNVEGQFCLAIKLIGGGVTGTMRIIDGMVCNTGTTGAVAPTSSVPTYQEILSTYAAMVSATSAANLAIAEEFDASENYPAGKNVINDGALYVLPNGHTAGTTWANTTKVASNLGDQVTDLKSAFDNCVLDRYGKYVSKNIINGENSLTAGYIAKNGTVSSSTSYAYTDYLPVSEGDVLRTYYTQQGVFSVRGMRYICCYNTSKSVMSSAGTNTGTTADNPTFTIPSGVAFVRVTVYQDSSKSEHVVTLNCTVSAYSTYEAPKQVIEDDFLSPESQIIVDELKSNTLLSSHLKNNLHCSFPRQKLKMTKGIEESFYYFPAVFPPKTSYGLLTAGSQYSKKYNNKVTFANDTLLSSTNGYNWYMYDALYALVNSYTGNSGFGGARSIIDENLTNCSLLAIGDSTVDHDTMTATLLSHFTEQEHTITLLGTLGDGTSGNKNEGRAGWKASDYLTNKQYNGVVNPFYNPSTQTFDFSYYMTNQSYASVDFVVLQLGINDLSDGTDAATLWTTMKVLIDSILDFNSSIKIIMNLPTTPNSDQSQTGNSLMSYLLSVCRYNEYALAHILSEYNAANIRASYCHLILDPDTEIRDNVHPTADGYTKMALEIVNQINHWQNSD